MGKAVESFRVDDIASGEVVSNIPSSVDSLSGTAGSLPSAFTGTQSASALTYATNVSKTPSSAYTYRYVAPGTPTAIAAGTNRQLVAGVSGQPLYALCANLVNAANPYYCVAEGSGGNLSNSDQALASVGLGNLSAAATTGLVAWYQLDGSGTSVTATDSSGNGIAGSLINFTFDGTSSGWMSGKFGNALKFNGSSEYAALQSSPSLQLAGSSLTFSAWVNPTPTNLGWNGIIGGDSRSPSLGLQGGQNLRFTNVNIQDAPSATMPVPSGTWTHVVATLNATTGILTYFINGNIAGSFSFNIPASSNRTNTLGKRASNLGGDTFNGSIDDVRIYNRALSTGEAQQLYQGTL